jgi:Domain of unknown function (DUF4375)
VEVCLQGKMSTPLAKLIDSADDGALCAAVYDRLVREYGPDADVGRLPEAHRTVLLVEFSSGVVLNGGFTALFASELPGDPAYQHLLRAYESLGPSPVVAAVGRVFDAFPGRVPPADRQARHMAFASANRAGGGRLNTDFFEAHDGLVTAVASYIRAHREAFTRLDGTAPAPPPRERPRSGIDLAGAHSAKLPRWARVAFSARCARLVLPLWDNAWPDSPPEYRAAIEEAIRLAEACAFHGRPMGDVQGASSAAISAGGAGMVTQYGLDKDLVGDDPPPRDPYLVLNVANAAAKALDLVSGSDNVGSYGYAKGAIEMAGREDLMDRLQDDFRRLRRIVRDGGWTNRTPVPPEAFDPEFEPPQKPWWKVW